MASSAETPIQTPNIVDIEQQYVLQNYARYPLVIESGKGCCVYDDKGRRYLDFISGIGVNALGHAHPRIVKVVREQVGKLVHCSNLYYHPYQGPLAARLAERSGLQRTFFCNSGTEAMEGALKMARAFGRKQDPAKYEIVSLDNSFHGRTLGALSVTGQAKYRGDFEPLLPGVRFVPVNDMAALEQAVSERTAAVVLEPILGEGGIVGLTREFSERAADLAQRHNALLIFDEIQCGLGRTGAYFAFQLWHQDREHGSKIMPDVLVTAKPLGCGFPIGAIVANERAAAAIGAGMHGSTFGGGALVCRVALEFLDLLPDLLPAIRENGRYFRRRLQALVDKYEFVRQVRGEGLMVGLDLAIPGKPFVLEAMEKGFLINCTHDTVLRFLPPYIIEQKDISRLVDALDAMFAHVQSPPAGGAA
ncbi:MAG: aspartate aminotransferase family protein [Acidobacteria bacterium]|nr:aspartate aminotransferase family protein [Acidobacteriota bacterium]